MVVAGRVQGMGGGNVKLHWVRPNDVDITACGKSSEESVRPLTYLHAEAADFYKVARKVHQMDRCRKCERINATELPK